MSIFEFIEKHISEIKEPIIFEIGAHIGIDSEKISKIINSKIWGFEPDPRNLEILNTKKAHFFHEVSSFAISDIDGQSPFYISSGIPPEIYEDEDMNRDWSASNSLKKPFKHLDIHSWCKFDLSIIVQTIRLDTYCSLKNISHIDFVWMDVQGAEDLVIKGMGNMKKNIKYIYTEYNSDQLYYDSCNKDRILDSLGDGWEIIMEYENDIIIENKNYIYGNIK
jgi:FkbM family methyltransferase